MLSPLFDVNPSRQRGVIDSRAINDSDDPGQRQLRNLLSSASAYRRGDAAARGVLRRVADAVSRWDGTARELGIAPEERELLQLAFDPEQLAWALSLWQPDDNGCPHCAAPRAAATEKLGLGLHRERSFIVLRCGVIFSEQPSVNLRVDT